MKLQNFVKDDWMDGDGDGRPLLSAVDGRPLASITSDGLDFAAMLDHARTVGGAGLRKLTFHERGDMLKALAQYLMEHKKEFYALSTDTGATRSDSSGWPRQAACCSAWPSRPWRIRPGRHTSCLSAASAWGRR